MFDDIFNGADALLLFVLLAALFLLIFPEVLVRTTLRFLPSVSKAVALIERDRPWQEIEATTRPRLEELLRVMGCTDA